MAPGRALVLLAGLAQGCGAAMARERVTFKAPNPIRRVVDMLQNMQQKVQDEGKAEKKLFDNFMCYCENGASELSNSVGDAQTRLPQIESSIAQAKALKDQLQSDLKQHKADREEAKATIAQATELREKEQKAFGKDSSDMKTNSEALGKAIAALERGSAGSFLQTSAAATLRKLSITLDMTENDRDLLSGFLADGNSYGSPTGQIVGILKVQKETLDKTLAEAVTTEKKRVEDFKSMVAAKEAEVEASTQAIESKMERVGQLGVEIVTLEADYKDTTKGLAQDREFLANLGSACEVKKQEWEERSKTRSEELVALSETIKILNDDDALDIFKETLPSPALLQLQVSGKEVKRQALAALRAHRGTSDRRVDLIALELTGRSTNFDQVLKMIDGMVDVLGKEQKDDDSKKSYCQTELNRAEDNKKVLDRTASDLEVAIEDGKENLSRLETELAALAKGIEELDKQVAKATANRQAENEEYTKTSAANNSAKQLLEMAKNRLAKFYTPSLAKAMLVQASAQSSANAAPAPPPETWGAYKNKGEESAGVMALLDALKADLDRDLQEGAIEEKNAQKEYEQFIQDSANKRAGDAAAIAQKEGAKADLEVSLQKLEQDHKSAVTEGMAKAEFIKDLHGECDWLLANYDVRKEARVGEVDSLKKAKAVLSGADYSLVQTATAHRLRGMRSAVLRVGDA